MKRLTKFYSICGILLLGAALLLVGCKEQVDTSSRYVFEMETIASYLLKHDDYSEYARLLDEVKISKHSESTVMQLLSARGNYTCFAPTNQAIGQYLDSLVAKGLITAPSWEAFPTDEMRDSVMKVIVFNSIIDGGDFDYEGNSVIYETSSFPANQNEEIASPTLSDRKLSVLFGNDPDSIYINKTARISVRNRDIPAINGVIHQMEDVIAPGNDALTAVLQSYIDANRDGFQVMARLVLACGLGDTLSKIRDEAYEDLYQMGVIQNLGTHPTEGSLGYLPEHRKYGFTIFSETDQFWSQTLGKEPRDIMPEDVMNYLEGEALYPDAVCDNNYTNEKILLNQFGTYHILPVRLPADKLVIHYNERGYDPKVGTPGVCMYDLYTSMGERRIVKIFESRESDGVYLNRFPKINNGRSENYHEKYCDADKVGVFVDRENANVESVNGIIYPIDKLLVYDEATRNNLQRQRLRWDVSSLFPEFLNNDIRGQSVTTKEHMTVGIPSDDQYKYFNDMDILRGTKFYYLLGRGKGWPNYLGDEFNVIGRYELVMRLPPVPKKGTYEFRIANSTGVSYRSMCQVYWGSDKNSLTAMGTPLDFRVNGLYRLTDAGTFPSPVGWELDTDDDDYNAEVDKKMRNNGFMKGLQLYCAGSPGSATPGRGSVYLTRRIMFTATMDPDVTYYLRLKNVLDKEDKQLYMDFIEICSKEVYDNPEEPEDIW